LSNRGITLSDVKDLLRDIELSDDPEERGKYWFAQCDRLMGENKKLKSEINRLKEIELSTQQAYSKAKLENEELKAAINLSCRQDHIKDARWILTKLLDKSDEVKNEKSS
jgi:hypothetical protein